MITVTCPNCKTENSALSRRCISCSAELIIDGHVRCDNCRALTPQKLEFCELCGSYLSTVNNLGNHDLDHGQKRDELRPPLASATPSLNRSPGDDEISGDSRNQVTKGVQEAQPSGIRDDSKKSEEPLVPTWLLDVDAALKTSGTADLADESTGTPQDPSGRGTSVSGSTSAVASQAGQTIPSESPQPAGEGSESLDWVNALAGDFGDSAEDHGQQDGEGTQSDSKQEGGTRKKTKPDTAPLVGLGLAGTRRQSTQPLDSQGNLLGVPQQLAGTDLPSWLSDQLQHAGEPRDDPVIDDIELPEPTRATILSPGEPDVEEESSPFDDSVLDPSFEKWLQEFTEEPISPDWMEDDDVQIDQPMTGGVVLPGAETPEWLHDIHEEEGETAELLGIIEVVEATGRLSGIKGAIQIEPVIAALVIDSASSDYSISKEQLQKIALLEGIIHAEPVKKKRTAIEPQRSSPVLLRVVLAGALIVVIVLAAVVPSSMEWLDGFASTTVSRSAQELYDQLEDASGAPVLVAFDYTPAMAGELNPISLTLLEQLAGNGSVALTLSQSAAGAEVASIVVEEVEDLDWLSIGYLPGEAVGLRSLSECIDGAENCETLFGKALPNEIQESLAEAAAVLILTSDSESLIDWIEQVGAPHEDAVLLAGVTQALGPVVQPYYLSDQLKGVLIGLPDIVAYEQELLVVDSDDSSITSGAIVIWMIAAFLLAGLIYYAITGLRNSRSE